MVLKGKTYAAVSGDSQVTPTALREGPLSDQEWQSRLRV